MIKLAVMQPYFLPYIGYFQLVQAVDCFVLYDQVDYIRHGWINRNRFLQVHDAPVFFIVPISGKQSGSRICEIKIDNHEPWNNKLRRTIEMNYRRSPWFKEVFSLIEPVLNQTWENLSTLNICLIRSICEYLDVQTTLVVAGGDIIQLESGIRNQVIDVQDNHVGEELSDDVRTSRILTMCRHFGANVYVNAIGGQNLYSKLAFQQSGVELLFIRSRPYVYQQRALQFYPDLSILDVLMNCGKTTTRKMLDEYDLM